VRAGLQPGPYFFSLFEKEGMQQTEEHQWLFHLDMLNHINMRIKIDSYSH
jgi:hypothetical protein